MRCSHCVVRARGLDLRCAVSASLGMGAQTMCSQCVTRDGGTDDVQSVRH